jgi:tetratricopeptide (TPR) repeat protein
METGADVHYQLGKAYEGIGRNDLAMQQYNEVLKYIPDDAKALLAIQQLQLKSLQTRTTTSSTKK